MDTLTAIYRSSVGKKIVVALTGLFLCVYLIVHLGGNLLLFRCDGGASFNAYAEFLPNLLVIRIIEILLFAIFIGHILTGTILWILNRRARPRKYLVNNPQDNSSWFSRAMFLTGSIVFIFIVVHMGQFWYPSRYSHAEGFSMYALVVAAFSDPLYAGLYSVAMVLLAFHLRQGFQSASQTFGWRTRSSARVIEALGVIFWLLIPLGFISMPVYFFGMSCHWFG